MSQGTRAGLASVLGVEVGNAVHVAAAAAGLAALLAASAMAFTAVKYLGAGYLAYLGLRRLLSSQAGARDEAGEPVPAALGRVFAQAVAVAVLNPKTALFFLAFLPQFVDPARGSAAAQVLALGGLFVGVALLSDGAYALLAGRLGRWLWRHPRFVTGERYVSGTVYLGLGAVAAFSSAPSSAKP